jgi:hypothetical protein
MGIRYPRTRLHGFARCDGSGHCVVFPFPQAYRPSPSGGPGLCLHSGGVARVLGFGYVFWSSDPYLVVSGSDQRSGVVGLNKQLILYLLRMLGLLSTGLHGMLWLWTVARNHLVITGIDSSKGKFQQRPNVLPWWSLPKIWFYVYKPTIFSRE